MLDSQITFRYFDYDFEKKRSYRRNGERYTVSPFALIYSEENYYLLGCEKGKFRHYRVDRMADVTMLAVEREGKEEFSKIDLAAYTKRTFSMFGGKEEKVTMIFDKKLMDAVIDRFGKDIMVTRVDEKRFRVTVTVAISPQFFGWIFGLKELVRIVEPEHVVQQMKRALEDVQTLYGEGEKADFVSQNGV